MEPLIQFCEKKYVVSENIAEFNNTISNLAYIFAALMITINGGCKIISKDIFMIGIGSALFHSCPNIITEILDELWILIFVCDVITLAKGRNLHLHSFCIYLLGISMNEFLVFYTLLSLISIYASYLLFINFPKGERTFDGMFFIVLGKICWYLEHYGGYCDMHVLWHILSAISLYHVGMLLSPPSRCTN